MPTGLMLGVSLASVSMGGAPFTPAALGAYRLAEWDMDSGLTLATTKVSTWTDGVSSIAPTEATDALRPTYDATGFLGRPAVDWNAAASAKLTALTLPAAMPSGAEPFDFFAIVRQDALAGDATTRCLFSFGTTAATGRFSLTSVVNVGFRRFAASVGSGGSSATARNDLVDGVGVHWVHVRVEADGFTITVDGVASTKTALVPSIGSDKLTLGCITNVTPGNFWDGASPYMLVSELLPANELNRMRSWLNSQCGF